MCIQKLLTIYRQHAAIRKATIANSEKTNRFFHVMLLANDSISLNSTGRTWETFTLGDFRAI